jgi:hypothetical protein
MRLHSDAKYRSLSRPQPNGQSLWYHLLTGPSTTNIPGLYRAGELGLSEELDWPLKAFREAFREVFAKGMAKADWDNRLVWIPNAIKYDFPASPNVVTSWRTVWDELPDCQLKYDAWCRFNCAFDDRKAFAKAFAKACRKPSRKVDPKCKLYTSPNPEPEPDQEPEPEPEPEKNIYLSTPDVPGIDQDIDHAIENGLTEVDHRGIAIVHLNGNDKKQIDIKDIGRVVEHYLGHHQDRGAAARSKETRALIKARLLNRTVETLCRAIDGAVNYDFNARNGYDSLMNVMKSEEQIDRYLRIRKTQENGSDTMTDVTRSIHQTGKEFLGNGHA